MHSRRFWHSCSDSFGPDLAYAGEPGRRFERAARRHERWLERAMQWESRRHGHGHGAEGGDDFFGAGLGVRRPLRFLAWKLDLDEEQTAALARILEQLKLERAQAALDLRRAAASLADAFAGEFGAPQAAAAAEQRAAAGRRVQDAMAKALEELHGLLEPDQRRALAELIRTGGIRF
jgi:cyclopropane fatty-acyl-phospholipid synthase-like methyltransferase